LHFLILPSPTTVLALPSAFLRIGKDNTQHAICFFACETFSIRKRSSVGGALGLALAAKRREGGGKKEKRRRKQKSCPCSSYLSGSRKGFVQLFQTLFGWDLLVEEFVFFPPLLRLRAMNKDIPADLKTVFFCAFLPPLWLCHSVFSCVVITGDFCFTLFRLELSMTRFNGTKARCYSY